MFKDFKWYRRWKGGHWYYIKNRTSPSRNLFCWWTRQVGLYRGISILREEDYNHNRSIKNERLE